ncbi:MAG TPA: hypothetical protein VHE34_04140 [Puia sp.]|uniref:hypothetical protein n=1 Tax=Puia sp. TaxID=2045100 RepID=UPI002B933CC4|nr:hypothetical protein [Puia sp.]HVU94385.1 hypothetical protein [Puia sp.]
MYFPLKYPRRPPLAKPHPRSRTYSPPNRSIPPAKRHKPSQSAPLLVTVAGAGIGAATTIRMDGEIKSI